jgi:large subunit ribosomal protein L13
MNHNHKQKTPLLTYKEATARRRWYLFDARGKTLGRLATEVVRVLRGKHRPDFTPNVDGGESIIIINAKDVHLTGRKPAQKMYNRYTGHIGGMKQESFKSLQARKPGEVIRHAVWGMMPRTHQSREQIKRLRIYGGAEHDMEAQQPIQVNS